MATQKRKEWIWPTPGDSNSSTACYAASAAYRVGYRDASHFNREYKSLFGVPPMFDVQRLREATRESTDP